MGKHIKVKIPAQPTPALPPVQDLVLNFASDTHVYTIRVKASQMGLMAKGFCGLMKTLGIVHTIEEKPR